MKKVFQIFAMLLLMCFPGIFLGIGLFGIIPQHSRIDRYLPAPAHIIHSNVYTHSTHGRHASTSYGVNVLYSYRVNGRTFQSSVLLPLPGGMSTSNRSWADGIARRYKAGTDTTAYYSSADPSKAFLVREAEFLPHIFALVGGAMMVVCIGLLINVITGFGRLVTPQMQGAAGYKLTESRSIVAWFRYYAFCGALWWIFWIAIVGDYFTANGNLFDAFCIVISILCIGLGVIPIIFALRYLRLHHDFLDADVTIKHDRIKVGDSVDIHLQQIILRPITIEYLRMGLVCMIHECHYAGNKAQYDTREYCADLHPIVEGKSYQSTSQITGQASIPIPTDRHATSQSQRKYPWYEWRVEVRVKVEGEKELKLKYPVVVEGGGMNG